MTRADGKRRKRNVLFGWLAVAIAAMSGASLAQGAANANGGKISVMDAGGINQVQLTSSPGGQAVTLRIS